MRKYAVIQGWLWSSGRALACLVTATSALACGQAERDRPDPDRDGRDAAAFSAIDVHVQVSGGDAPDLDARDADGGYPDEPPLQVVFGAVVRINGGTSDGRVPGLRVLADGAELTETASAGLPQQFSFQHHAEDVAQGRGVTLEFEHQGSSFELALSNPRVELTWPAPDAVFDRNEPLTVEWTGTEAAPEASSVQAKQNCTVAYTHEGHTLFVPQRNEGGRRDPPCRFELSVRWRIDVIPPVSPFRSLRVDQWTRRIRRFSVE